MNVTHFEIVKRHGQFELLIHSVDERGKKHAALASEGRDIVMWRLIDRCFLNGEFRHLQRNAK
jgi:hypothetical protein